MNQLTFTAENRPLKGQRQILLSGLIIFLAYLAAAILTHLPYFIEGNTMLWGDGISYLNSRSFASQGILGGDLAMWSPYERAGAAFLAEMKAVYFYPPVYLSLFLPPALYSNVYYVLSLALAGSFMCLFMGEIQQKRPVSILTGFVFMFSTMFGYSRVSHISTYSTVLWLPLILYFVQRYIRTKKRSQLLFSAVAMAIQFFAGYTQVFVYSSVFVLLYLIVFIEKDKKYLKKYLIDIGIWAIMLFLLACALLIPLAELTVYTKKADIGYSSFSLLSTDYRILPMIFFPDLYPYTDKVLEHSAEINIEVYLGLIVAVFAIYATVRYFREKKIRTFAIFTILALIYSMIGNIPVLGEIVYRIPVLGSFHVASRMLFFYAVFGVILFGLMLNKLEDKKEAKKFLRFCAIVFAFVVFVILLLKSLCATPIASDQMKELYAGIDAFLPSLLVSGLLLAVTALYCYAKFFRNKKHGFIVFAALLTFITVADTCRFSLYHIASIDLENGIDEHEQLALAIQAQPDQEFYRTMGVSYRELDLLSYPLSFYNNLRYDIKAFNAPSTFELTNWSDVFPSRDFVFVPEVGDIMREYNSTLSSLSIKYLVEKASLSQRGVGTGKLLNKTELFRTEEPISIEPFADDSIPAIAYAAYPVEIDSNKLYILEYSSDLQSADESPTLYFDFYGGGYDGSNFSVELSTDGKQNRIQLSAGDQPLPEGISLRLIAQTSGITGTVDFIFYEAEPETVPFEDVYTVLGTFGEVVLFENKNAVPILNIANGVSDMKDFDKNAVLETSFIDNPPSAAKTAPGSAQVDIIEFKNNSIKGAVIADEEVFVNHTQSMYPGWNVYIDGQKSTNYLVNGITQGAYVPAGEHTVEFRFEPVSVYLGIALTCAGIALLVLLLLLQKRKQKK
ncbi:MAG: YfhO family protein [Christensenellaceae bacterium]|jgi:hypothetical protein